MMRRVFLASLLSVAACGAAYAAVCIACNGTGTSNFVCGMCGGAGHNNGLKCFACRGRGFAPCPACNGRGQR